ncbi:MAG: carbonic anhydrase, partial [Gemmataceae bacterium]
MFDLIYRFDPKKRLPDDSPRTPEEARERLENGNRFFASADSMPLNAAAGTIPERVIYVDANHLGLPDADGNAPKQRPFAAILGCADARVPVEMIFNQACNDLFVVRVAGNVLGTECLGSLDFALANLGESIKVVVVLGHRHCGAVVGAVDAFIDPAAYLRNAFSHSLRAVVDRIFVATRAAHKALEEVYTQEVEKRPGYR